jgi:hypothetical protein
MRLWLDDERDPKEWLPHISWWRGRDPEELAEWVWVKAAPEAIALLESEDIVEASLDHDLGDSAEVGDGYMVATWIEEKAATDDSYRPPILHVHSSNVGGRQRLEAAVASIERFVTRRNG